ncbi:NAD-dependent epimerase/dehydratase family protein [Chryseobacterium sp. 2R14A]|uniref:NAD-dependent epimerase/dehydratase family protein n=1 Tax=Chryseobacterium sp. 2R14A TaxID=3380353 RepID=UPI003CEC4E97
MILVTGATGILGRVIVLELLRKGKTVYAAKRSSSDIEDVKKSYIYYTRDAEMFFDKIHWIDLELNDFRRIEKKLIGIEEIYHCAAKVSYDPKDEHEISKINIEGTKNILKAAVQANIKKFLYVSSAAIFATKKDQIISENSEYNNFKKATFYAAAKYKAELQVLKAVKAGLKTIMINPGMIIGSGNWNDSSGQLLTQLINSKYTYSGGTGCVDVRDVAKIAIALMEKNKFGELFILVSENKKYVELHQFINKNINKLDPFILSKNILLIGRFSKIFLGRLFPELRMLTKPNIEFLASFPKLSNKKLMNELQYHFIPIEESIHFHIGNYLHETIR